jgi:hypothetical protein
MTWADEYALALKEEEDLRELFRPVGENVVSDYMAMHHPGVPYEIFFHPNTYSLPPIDVEGGPWPDFQSYVAAMLGRMDKLPG